MKIDLTNLITNLIDSINISEKVIVDESLIENSNIKRLENVVFNGKITKDSDMNLELSGVISGNMVLPDDITLEDTDFEFKIDVLENVEQICQLEKNTIDILDFLWQNILVEVPLKVQNPNRKDIKLEGDGWRLITEEELENRKYNPFSDLSTILDKGGK